MYFHNTSLTSFSVYLFFFFLSHSLCVRLPYNTMFLVYFTIYSRLCSLKPFISSTVRDILACLLNACVLIWPSELSISQYYLRFIGILISDSVVVRSRYFRSLVRNRSSRLRFFRPGYSRENFASPEQTTIYEFNLYRSPAKNFAIFSLRTKKYKTMTKNWRNKIFYNFNL